MKNKISAGLYIVLGAALGIIPRFTVCPWTAEHGYMQCWETAKIMSLFGIVFVVVGVVISFAKKLKLKIGLNVFSAVAAPIGILVPLKIVGGCMDMGMACHTVAFPIIYVISIVIMGVGIAGAAQGIIALKQEKSALSVN